MRSRNIPGTALRYTQRLSMKRGGLGYERDSLEPMIRGRAGPRSVMPARGLPACSCGWTSSRTPEGSTTRRP